MAQEIYPIEEIEKQSEDLPLFYGKSDVVKTKRNRSAEKFLELVLLNQNIVQITENLDMLGVKAWLTSGCLVQTIWNLRSGKNPHADIDDYDLIYFDTDDSWEAEDIIIRRTKETFSNLSVSVQIRNQARVPLWYYGKYGICYPPVREAPHALLRYPSRTTAIALTYSKSRGYVFYAPFGFKDATNMVVRPNRRLDIADVYETKSRRWKLAWPALTVCPWD